MPLNIRKSGTNHKQYAPQKIKRSVPRNVELAPRGGHPRVHVSKRGTQSRQGKQWQLHSGSVLVVVHAVSSLYVVRLELSRFAHTPRTG